MSKNKNDVNYNVKKRQRMMEPLYRTMAIENVSQYEPDTNRAIHTDKAVAEGRDWVIENKQ